MIVKRHLIQSVLLGTIATFIVAMTTVVGTTGTARADGEAMHNPASGTLNANCAGCHRIHTAPAANLLKQTDVVALCKTCHGAGGTGSDLNVDLGSSSTGALRGGGFQQTLIDTADPSGKYGGTASSAIHIGVTGPHATTSSHSVSDSSVSLPIWGNSSSGWSTSLTTFTCANCHDPHGGSDSGKPTYRILRVQPTGADNGTTKAVVTDELPGPRHYTTTDYYNPAVGLVNPTVPSSNPDPLLNVFASGGISTWCAQCHKAYLQTSFPAGETPNGTVGNYAGKYLHQASDVSISHTTGLPALASRTCEKCHVAHGTSASMSSASATIDYPDGSAAVAGGNSRLLKMDNRGICRKCHGDK